MNNSIYNVYNQLITKYSGIHTKQKEKLKKFTFLRGLFFILIFLVAIVVNKYGIFYTIISIVVFGTLFLWSVTKSLNIKKHINYLTNILKINNNEVEALNGNIQNFEDGSTYVDFEHQFSYDLDIFGKGSVFQYLNRTCTSFGSFRLAQKLKFPALDSNLIINYQGAIAELSDLLNWRQNFLANGFTLSDEIKNENAPNVESILNWKNIEIWFSNKIFYKIVIFLLPVLMILSTALTIIGVIEVNKFIILTLLPMAIVFFNIKRINKLHSQISRKSELLDKYIRLFQLFENEKFTSNYLINLQKELLVDGTKVNVKLLKLNSLVKSIDLRLNLIFAFVANVLVLWDLQCIIRIEKWIVSNSKLMEHWFEIIGEVDALISFANMKFNNPSFVFPSISDNYIIESSSLGHPLINEKDRVCNDFYFTENEHVAIITGANMAGKSTFLRTIGVNLIFAMLGMPVCANCFKFKPIEIFTSIRANDSLKDHESYFYAELKRLQELIQYVKSEANVFVIIDEMLRGTNSKDKHHGSVALVKQLLRKNCKALVATHDIQLGNLKNDYAEAIKNLRFEVEIQGDKLYFDYKIREGISQSLNATFLMQKMGIIS